MEERKCARESNLRTQSDGAMNDNDAVAFIEARRGQADRPIQCRAALPAASLRPRRCLARRPAGGSALVADDAPELQDRDDDPSFFTLPLIFPQSDQTPAKD